MNVEKVMTRGVVSCSTTDTLNRAAQIMWEHDEHGRVAGVVTDRDLCMAAYTNGGTLTDMPVMQAVSRPRASLALPFVPEVRAATPTTDRTT
jgi:CBS domain-containing protein